MNRTRDREQLRPYLRDKLKQRSADEWFALLATAGLPCGPITAVKDGGDGAGRFGLAAVVEVGEDTDMVLSIRNPISLSGTPSRYCCHHPPHRPWSPDHAARSCQPGSQGVRNRTG
ncbi:CoA transferase [Streptomyces canus]|uniref:CoA transferase n=1 Tax=Streptomyces canus TaxID=58343 RepID=UPI002E3526AE|nr:CoA transferase [Streptomyces canus]